MKNKSRDFIVALLYVIALFSFLGAITATSRGSLIDFSNLARLICCGLAVICVIAAFFIWKAKDACGKNKIIVMLVAIVVIVGGGFIDSYLEHNTGAHEYTSDMYKISEAVAAKFESASGEFVVVDSEIALLSSLAELEIQEAPMTPDDDPEEWIYRVTFNPVEKVPNGDEIIVYVHEKYIQIGDECYLPKDGVSFETVLAWFEGKAAYFLG